MPEAIERRRRWVAPAAGIAAVAVGVGLAELLAGLIAPTGSPVLVVGSALIDLAPPWAKDAAIALFGTADKAALVVGICLVLAAAAALVGVLEVRRPPLGRVLLGLGAIAGVAAAITRSGGGMLDVVPPVAAAVFAAIALRLLLRRAPIAGRNGLPRRAFLGWLGATAGAGALAAAGGALLQSGVRAAVAARDSRPSSRRTPSSTASTPPCRCRDSTRAPGGCG